jgi:hypothetical protein
MVYKECEINKVSLLKIRKERKPRHRVLLREKKKIFCKKFLFLSEKTKSFFVTDDLNGVLYFFWKK